MRRCVLRQLGADRGAVDGMARWTVDVREYVKDPGERRKKEECDSMHGCDAEHAGQPSCGNNVVTWSDAVWSALGPNNDVGRVDVTWSIVKVYVVSYYYINVCVCVCACMYVFMHTCVCVCV